MRSARNSRQISPEAKEFLHSLFSGLRDDLSDQVGDPEAVAEKRRIYDALLAGLADEREMPDDEEVREYIGGLAKATDEANQYAQAALEHRAFAELVRALDGEGAAGAVDWDEVLAERLHSTQLQIVEAMGWIGHPVSASQLVRVFERDRKDLASLSYHLRRLREMRIVRLYDVRQTRGAKERVYELVPINP
jgi:DNA-binding transcriptional ArsR family regulator